MSWQDQAQESLNSTKSSPQPQSPSWSDHRTPLLGAPEQSSTPSSSGQFIELQQESSSGSDHQGPEEGGGEGQDGGDEDNEDLELLTELR